MKKIKVLMLIGHMGDGGAQRIILNYLNDLSFDSEVEIKVLVYGEQTNSYCDRIIEQNNYDVDYMFKNIHNKYIRKSIKVLFGDFLLTNYIRKYNPDIVHVHISPFITVCLKSILKCKVPIRFDTLHSNPYRFKGKDLTNIRRAFQDEGFIGICVTNEQVKQAKDHYGLKRYEVVHNGVDIEKIKERVISREIARDIFNFDKDYFIIGAVGRLDKVKRYDLLLRAFSEVIKKKKKSILVIAGDGPEKMDLMRLSKELKIDDSVIFLGNIDKVIEFYCAIDVLAVTSESESSSLVLIEGQVCGTRCVISDGTPSESIVTNRVKKMDVDATIENWANALLDENFVGEYEYNFSDYEVHAMSQKMKDIYLKYWEDYQNEKQ